MPQHLPAPLASSAPRMRSRLRSSVDSAGVARKMRFPVRVHLLALLIELPRGGELVMAHPRTGFHDAFGGVEHQEASVRSYLEILPGNRHVIFIDPENPAAGNDQICDLARLRAHHDVVDAAE